MKLKLGAAVLAVTGVSALILFGLAGNLISQAFSESTVDAQKQPAKSQAVDASRTVKASPGTPDACC